MALKLIKSLFSLVLILVFIENSSTYNGIESEIEDLAEIQSQINKKKSAHSLDSDGPKVFISLTSECLIPKPRKSFRSSPLPLLKKSKGPKEFNFSITIFKTGPPGPSHS